MNKNQIEDKYYIFGYGSLMEKESRSRTTPNVKYIHPIKLNGYKRSWSFQNVKKGEAYSTTFLGCEKDINTVVNGILYQVTKEEVFKTIEREKGYDIRLINNDDITKIYDLDFKVDSNVKIFIFLNGRSHIDYNNIDPIKVFEEALGNKELEGCTTKNSPCKEFPITQSNVDICLNGCLEIENQFPEAKEAKFLEQFLKNTYDWSENTVTYWVNDRIYPRRPWKFSPNSTKIDESIVKHLGLDIFESVKIE